MDDNKLFTIESDEGEQINKLWQKEYDLRNVETVRDKGEGLVDAVLAITIIGVLSFVMFQLSLPYLQQFFRYISHLSITS